MSDEEKVAYYKTLITKDTLTNESAAAIRSNLILDKAYGAYGETGATVVWTSENPGIDADGTVTQSALPQYGKLTATITAGEVSDSSVFEFTVAPSKTVAYENIVMDFEGKSGEVAPADISSDTVGITSASFENDKTRNSTVLKAIGGASTESLVIAKNGGNKSANGTERVIVSVDLKYEQTTGDKFTFQLYGNGPSVYLVFDFNLKRVGMFYWQSTRLKYWSMPEGFTVGEWFHLDIDMNTMSRSYKAYINGEILNENGIPYQMANAKSLGVRPMRNVVLYFDNAGIVYIDNLAINTVEDIDSVKADAAVNAVLVTYAGPNLNNNNIFGFNTILTSATLPAEGPTDGKTYGTGTSGQGDGDNHSNYSFSDGASLSYKANGVALQSNTVSPTGASTVTYEITASSGDATATGSFTRKTAPVIIESIDFVDTDGDDVKDAVNSVTLNRAYPTGAVVVGTYNGNILTGVTVAQAMTAVVPVMFNIPKSSTVKVFVWDISGGEPLAFPAPNN